MTVNGPVKVLPVPVSTKVPAPDLVKPIFAPLSPILPPKVKTAPVEEIVSTPPPKVRAPVPKFRSFANKPVRVKAAVPWILIGLLPALVMAAPELLLIVEAAVTVKAPAVAPRAFA